MAVRDVLRYPHPALKRKARPPTPEEATRVAQDLLDTMRAAPGIGITAAHIGVLKRVVVIELDAADGAHTYVNPEIVWASSATARHQEGSISMPGATEEIERPARVRVRYRTLDGAERAEEADGLLAVCLQHEIDQLDGIFWIQRLSRLKRDRLTKRFLKRA